MTKRQNISCGSPFETVVGFSRAVRIGNHIFVGATAPIGKDGKTVSIGDAERQTRRCFETIGDALAQTGSGFTDVVRTRCFLTDIKDWEKVAKVHGDIFKDIRPASTIIEVAGFINPEWLIEVEVDAVIADEG